MKQTKCLFYALLALVMMSFAACGDDNDDKDDKSKYQDVTVSVDDEGKTNDGSLFVAIDDKNFYLDYIKYTLVESHLEVTGYDKMAFNGEAHIVSKFTFNGRTFTVLSIADDAFRECAELTGITIPNTVTSIGKMAFYNCAALTGITFPCSVKTIGSAAFEGCERLSSISIPSSVTSIAPTAFSWCEALDRIVVEAGNSVYDSRGNCNAIIETKTNKMIAGCPNTIIPNGVTSLEYAFMGCTRLTSIVIPNSVTTIGSHAFTCCAALEAIQIPNSVKKIDEDAFHSCSSLTRVEIPNSVTVIGKKAFLFCRSLSVVTLSSSLVSIGDNAFMNCSSLKEIHSRMSRPVSFSYEVFDESAYERVILYIPRESSFYYNNTANWYLFRNVEEE